MKNQPNVRLVTITPGAQQIIMYCARVSNPKRQDSNDTRLLKYCMNHGHWSIFEMAHAVIEIETTRAISAQILRHRSFSFQEFSQRYTSISEAPCMPELRLAGASNRQSSIEGELTPKQRALMQKAQALMALTYSAYVEMIDSGIATECARGILPMSTKTKLYMAGNIRSWIHYIQLRTMQDTQKEHRIIAEECKALLAKELPDIIPMLDEIKQLT
jgi:thymidylate synthase (FAD)